MPWLLNEDEALKTKLEGLKVPDENAPTGGRQVSVLFRFPETELAHITYPMIVIEHSSLGRSSEREIRGQQVHLRYAPEGQAAMLDPYDVTTSPYYLDEYPIPYDIDYNVTTHCRLSVHDRILTAALADRAYLPSRFGYLEVPQDTTIRRLDLLGGPEPSDTLDSDGKRLFRKTYLIRVSSELLPSEVIDLTNILVESVKVDLSEYSAQYSV